MKGKRWRGRDTKASRSRRLRPTVMGLEDRTLLSMYTVGNLNDSGAGSLRQGILDANSTSGADVIDFEAGLTGTITLTSGELAITDDLTINGPGTGALTVSGGRASRVFDITGTPTVSISGLTIADGMAGSGAPRLASAGGGILNDGGTLTLDSVVLDSDQALGGAGSAGMGAGHSGGTGGSGDAGLGGGVYNGGGSVTITNSTLSNDTAQGGGGGTGGFSLVGGIGGGGGTGQGGSLYAGDGSVTVTNSTLADDTARGGAGGPGGRVTKWAAREGREAAAWEAVFMPAAGRSRSRSPTAPSPTTTPRAAPAAPADPAAAAVAAVAARAAAAKEAASMPAAGR